MGAGIASRVSGVEDYEHHPRATGCLWVHEIGDVSAAATAIERAATIDTDHRTRQARALAEAEFSAQRSVERYEPLLRQLRGAASLLPPWMDRHPALRGLVSMPVAAQRIARLWSRGRYRRPERVAVQ